MKKPINLRDELSARGVDAQNIDMALQIWECLIADAVGEVSEFSPTFTAHYLSHASRLLSAEHIDAEHLLSVALPQTLSVDPFRGYYVDAIGAADRRELATGDAALFWNGDSVETATFDRFDNAMSEFMALSERVISLIEAVGRLPTVLIDLGAGVGALSLCLIQAAQAAGINNLHAINVERECAALLSAQAMTDRLGLQRNIKNVVANVGAAIAGSSDLWARLADLVRQTQGAKGYVIVATRGALYPFYSTQEYQTLFAALIRVVGVDAGLHLEMHGNFTPTYERLVSCLNQKPFSGPTFYRNSADPFEYLATHTAELGISIYERMEIWPHFLHKYSPSYLAWRTDRTLSLLSEDAGILGDVPHFVENCLAGVTG